MFGDVDADIGIEQIARRNHSASRSCGGVFWRPSAMKSSGKLVKISKACPAVRGPSRNTTSSPRRKISTSLVLKRNSLGKRMAWLLPDRKTLAVGTLEALQKRIYLSVYTREGTVSLRLCDLPGVPWRSRGEGSGAVDLHLLPRLPSLAEVRDGWPGADPSGRPSPPSPGGGAVGGSHGSADRPGADGAVIAPRWHGTALPGYFPGPGESFAPAC